MPPLAHDERTFFNATWLWASPAFRELFFFSTTKLTLHRVVPCYGTLIHRCHMNIVILIKFTSKIMLVIPNSSKSQPYKFSIANCSHAMMKKIFFLLLKLLVWHSHKRKKNNEMFLSLNDNKVIHAYKSMRERRKCEDRVGEVLNYF